MIEKGHEMRHEVEVSRNEMNKMSLRLEVSRIEMRHELEMSRKDNFVSSHLMSTLKAEIVRLQLESLQQQDKSDMRGLFGEPSLF